MSTDRTFVTGQFYHIYNRGVAKQPIFHDEQDFRQFLTTLSFYLEDPPFTSLSAGRKLTDQFNEYLASMPTEPLVRIHAYCLMPNHFHLIIEQLVDGGLSKFLRLVQLSYTRAYNTRYRRIGPLFQGTFQAVLITSDEHLLHISRYIHLNPFVAKLVAQPLDYPWSSLPSYKTATTSRLITTDFILSLAGGSDRYQEFVNDYASYAVDLHTIKDSLIDL